MSCRKQLQASLRGRRKYGIKLDPNVAEAFAQSSFAAASAASHDPVQNLHEPPGAKDELPYLSFLIWNTDQKTGKVWRRNACRANGEANLLTCIDFDTGRKWLAKAFVSDSKDGAVWKWVGPGGDSAQIEGDD